VPVEVKKQGSKTLYLAPVDCESSSIFRDKVGVQGTGELLKKSYCHIFRLDGKFLLQVSLFCAFSWCPPEDALW